MEVKRIMDECYQKAKNILVENMDVLHRCAKLLLEKDRIDQKEFEQLFEAAETAGNEPENGDV